MSAVYLLSLKAVAGPRPLLDQAAPQKGSSDGGQRRAGPTGHGAGAGAQQSVSGPRDLGSFSALCDYMRPVR